MQRTFSIIKPDATKRNITGSINKIIEDNNLRIIAQKRIHLTSEQAEKFYDVHKEKSFFKDLRKEVETGANGTQDYVVKKGVNKDTVATTRQ